jgi:MFS family permease
MTSTFSIYMLQEYVRPALGRDEATSTQSLLIAAALPGSLAAMALAGRLTDRWGRRKPLLVGSALVAAAAMLVPLVWPSVPALYVQAVVGGAALGVYLVVGQALLIDVVEDPATTAGRDLGLGSSAGSLAQALGPLLAGATVATTAGYAGVWVLGSAAVGVGALSVLAVRGPR